MMQSVCSASGVPTSNPAMECCKRMQLTCVKRNGKEVPFDSGRILRAVQLCYQATGCAEDPRTVVIGVENTLHAINVDRVTVEDVQRFVLQQMWSLGLFVQAEHYQNYREERRKARMRAPVSAETQARFDEMRKDFPTDLQAYQFMSKFARWREDDTRRETWAECVDRTCSWLFRLPGCVLSSAEQAELRSGMRAMEVSPAMRVVQMAGP